MQMQNLRKKILIVDLMYKEAGVRSKDQLTWLWEPHWTTLPLLSLWNKSKPHILYNRYSTGIIPHNLKENIFPLRTQSKYPPESLTWTGRHAQACSSSTPQDGMCCHTRIFISFTNMSYKCLSHPTINCVTMSLMMFATYKQFVKSHQDAERFMPFLCVYIKFQRRGA